MSVLLAIQLALLNSSYAGDGVLKVPVEARFLDVVPGTLKGPFRINDGIFEQKINGEWSRSAATADKFTPSLKSEGTYLLGAPAVVLKTVSVDIATISKGHLPVEAAILGEHVWAIVETREMQGKKVQTNFEVLNKNKNESNFISASKFSLKENIYNVYLSQIYPVGDNLLGIVLSSSRNEYVSNLLLYDIASKHVVGFYGFSLFQYLPKKQSFWLVDSVPNCDNMAEALDAFRKKASIIPVMIGGKVNPNFSYLDDIIQ